ncbi:topoisomerase I damage affected protein 7-like [Penaeus monodon]|uniref:topoisomerase I damage affected protein 7-like n=1 Tax=Penaeus monodon TaxID=6687 RepID=UPI0018A7894F|nr:topoisomerase I damage affected protein 7-like [Penaeus monodon]
MDSTFQSTTSPTDSSVDSTTSPSSQHQLLLIQLLFGAHQFSTIQAPLLIHPCPPFHSTTSPTDSSVDSSTPASSSTNSPTYNTSSMESTTSSSTDQPLQATLHPAHLWTPPVPTLPSSSMDSTTPYVPTTSSHTDSSVDFNLLQLAPAPVRKQPPLLWIQPLHLAHSTSGDNNHVFNLLHFFHRLSRLYHLLYGIKYLFKYGHNHFFNFFPHHLWIPPLLQLTSPQLPPLRNPAPLLTQVLPQAQNLFNIH